MAEAKEPPLTPAQKQAVQEAKDANARKLEEKAPTTKTEMGKRFKKGGFVRAADGCAQRGKTKGRVI
jgi:hypothetical protein